MHILEIILLQSCLWLEVGDLASSKMSEREIVLMKATWCLGGT